MDHGVAEAEALVLKYSILALAALSTTTLENGYHGNQGTHLRRPLCSKYTCEHICYIWYLYHEMNNSFEILS